MIPESTMLYVEKMTEHTYEELINLKSDLLFKGIINNYSDKKSGLKLIGEKTNG